MELGVLTVELGRSAPQNLSREAVGLGVMTNEADRPGDPEIPRNLPELTAYAEANGWRLFEDVALPPSEWRGGPTGLPGWRLTFVKGVQAIGYEWVGFTTRHEAGRRVLRTLRKWDAPGS